MLICGGGRGWRRGGEGSVVFSRGAARIFVVKVSKAKDTQQLGFRRSRKKMTYRLPDIG